MSEFALIIIAYLMGSVSSAVILSRAAGLPDPRHEGSGNPGATNVLRLGGKKAAVLVLAGDVLKGMIPAALAAHIAPSPAGAAAVGLAAFLGHLYPIFFQFKGGKGVATALGVWLGLVPAVAGALVVVWLATALVTRISSLSALVAAVAAVPVALWLTAAPAYPALAAAMSALLIWRHRRNIRNLLRGAEPKIGRRPPDS